VVSDEREGYAIIREDGDTRTIEHFSEGDELILTVTQTRNRATGELEMSRTFYVGGVAVHTVTGTIRYIFEDGMITIPKEAEDGRTQSVVITEIEGGFTVERDGTTYQVIVENGAMSITFGSRTYLLVQEAGEWSVVG